MFSHVKSLLLILIASVSLVACSSTGIANKPATDIATTLTGKYTTAQVKSAIEAAGKQRKWTMKSKGAGVMEGVYQRQGHKVTIKITYNAKSYRISYVSSENMYEKVDADGNVSLHNNYMRWVGNLDSDIRKRLEK